jgi:hypothetical protein
MSLTSRMAPNETSSGKAHLVSDPAAAVPDRNDTARYIAALSAELSILARQVDLELLSYFLEMARMEAVAATASSKRGRKKCELEKQATAGKDKELTAHR